MKTNSTLSLVDLSNSIGLAARKPLLIAHRGGEIRSNSPENSRAAILGAAKRAYDMVELDVVQARDGVPVLFHGPQGHMGRDCGLDVYVHDLTSEALTQICYRESDQPIITLAEALQLCREHQLGVMLDIKNSGFAYAEQFFARTAALLSEYGLGKASLSFSQDPLAYKYLGDSVKMALSQEELNELSSLPGGSLEKRWWFGLPAEVSPQLVAQLQQRGVLVIVAINRFRYPAHAHEVLAQKDAQWLAGLGVDGLQIDSVYYDFVNALQ